MELIDRLLLAAFRHSINQPDLDSGLMCVAMIAGHDSEPNAWHPALDAALAQGFIRDPVRLQQGALQCHWHLELTPRGINQVHRLLQQHGKTAEELLAAVSSPGNP